MRQRDLADLPARDPGSPRASAASAARDARRRRSAGKYSRGKPMRRPLRSASGRGHRHRRPVDGGRVQGIVAADHAQHPARVAHRAAEHRDAVERASRRRPARSGSPGRSSASSPRRRRSSPAGAPIHRSPSRAPPARRRPPPARPSRRTSRPAPASGSIGCCTRPNAECSVDEPMANSSMFALAATIAPAARRRLTAVAVNGDM